MKLNENRIKLFQDYWMHIKLQTPLQLYDKGKKF